MLFTYSGNKPLAYDVFCGAGGATKGYQEAGFYVVGIDVKPQKNYCGDEFIQMDALEFLSRLLAGEYPEPFFTHASPPCQGYSKTKSIHNKKPWGNKKYPLLIEPTRELLKQVGKPYVIENVEDAPLFNYLMLCGSMFPELRVYRHRIFECSPMILFSPLSCNHNYSLPPRGMYHTLENHDFITCVAHNFRPEDGKTAMQIDWMTRAELAEAIPPAYTKFIGERLMEQLR